MQCSAAALNTTRPTTATRSHLHAAADALAPPKRRLAHLPAELADAIIATAELNPLQLLALVDVAPCLAAYQPNLRAAAADNAVWQPWCEGLPNTRPGGYAAAFAARWAETPPPMQHLMSRLWAGGDARTLLDAPQRRTPTWLARGALAHGPFAVSTLPADLLAPAEAQLQHAARDNFDCMRAAVEQDGTLLRLASPRLRAQPDLVVAAAGQNVHALRYADRALLHHDAFARLLLERAPLALQYLPPRYRSDATWVTLAVQGDGLALKDAAAALRDDPRTVMAAVKHNGLALRYAKTRCRASRDVVLAAVAQNGLALAHADRGFARDHVVVLTAITQNGEALQYADFLWRSNWRMAMAAVSQAGLSLGFIDPYLQQDARLVYAAVQQNGMALAYAAHRWRNDWRLVHAAVVQNGMALQFAHNAQQGNLFVVRAAVANAGAALAFATPLWRAELGTVMAAVANDPAALQHALSPARKHPDVLRIAAQAAGGST
jgi:hypothetical protein